MPSKVKKQIAQEYERQYTAVKNSIFLDYRGLSAKLATEFRQALAAEGIKIKVLRNNPARVALKNLGWPEADRLIDGPTAVIFGLPGSKGDNPVTLSKQVINWRAKVITQSAGKKLLEIKGGRLDGQLVSPPGVVEFSRLPTREVLLAQLAGVFNAPLTRLAYVCQALIQKTALLFDTLAQTKKE